jgi:succinoglycan biosynthesis transport protein ExoP
VRQRNTDSQVSHSFPEEAARQETSLPVILSLLRRGKYLLVIPTLVLGFGFGAFAFRIPDQYRSEALLTAEPMATARDFVNAAGSAHSTHYLNVDEQIRGIRQTVLSTTALDIAAREFGFWRESGPVPDRILEEVKSRITVGLDGGEEMRHSEPRVVYFKIGFEANSAEMAKKGANRLAELFVNAASSAREHRVEEVADFIAAELAPLRKKLEEQSAQIRGYKTGAARELPEQASANLRLVEALEVQYRASIDGQRKDEARRAAVADELRELEKRQASEGAAPVAKTAEEQKRDELRLQLKGLQARYTPDHPEVARVAAELKDVEKLVAAQPPKPRAAVTPLEMRRIELRSEFQGLDLRISGYKGEQDDISARLKEYQNRVASAPVHEKTLTDLSRDQTATQIQYEHLIEKQNEARLAERFERMNKEFVFRLVQPARLPQAPSSPQRERLILLGLGAGLGLGILVLFVRESMDSSFDDIESVQLATTIPVLVSVPSIAPVKANGSGKRANRIVALGDPTSVAFEQYRLLALKLQRDSAPGRVFAITSSAGGEGKTLTAVNLAYALSGLVDGKVLLIDGDLRRPRVHEYMGFAVKDGTGFGELLAEPRPDSAAHIRDSGGIAVIPGSKQSANPIGLLASPKARDLITRLRFEYHTIILDCPPVLPIADSLLLAGLADEVLFVVRARQTRREVFQRALSSLNASNLTGLVVNDVDHRRSRYAYAYRYYQKHYLAR